IGASGGIAGVITFYALAFPEAKIGFLWRHFYYFRWIRLPAWFVFVFWIVFQIIGCYEQKVAIGSVSSFAQFGGGGSRPCRVVFYPENRATRSGLGTQGSSPTFPRGESTTHSVESDNHLSRGHPKTRRQRQSGSDRGTSQAGNDCAKSLCDA